MIKPGSSDTAEIQGEIAKIKSKGGGVLDLQGDFQLKESLVIPPETLMRGPATLVWSNELSEPAVSIDPAADQSAAPKFEHINLVGPGTRNANTPLGSALTKMDGFAPGPCVDFTHCTVQNFRAGFNIKHHHNAWLRCRSNNNYYNILFDDTENDYGNHLFIGCYLEGALFASVGVSGANLINQSNFLQCHFGFGPYCFYKFGPSVKGFIAGTSFDECSYEAVGNAAFLDESTGGPGGQDSFFGSEIMNPGFSWDINYKIANRPQDYALNFRRIERSKIWGGCYPFLPGDKGVLRADYGDLNWDLGRFYGYDFSTLLGSDPNNGAIGAIRIHGESWSGGVYINSFGRAIKRGEPVEAGGSWFQANAFGLQTSSFLGIAMHDVDYGAPFVVATEGTAKGLCPGAGFGAKMAAVNGRFEPSDSNVVAIAVEGGSGWINIMLRAA